MCLGKIVNFGLVYCSFYLTNQNLYAYLFLLLVIHTLLHSTFSIIIKYTFFVFCKLAFKFVL